MSRLGRARPRRLVQLAPVAAAAGATSVSAGLATANATGQAPTVSVSANAGLATANATGQGATTSSATAGNPAAGLGSANATALAPTVSVSAAAGLGSASATGLAAAPTVGAGAGLGSANATALTPSSTQASEASAGLASAAATGEAAAATGTSVGDVSVPAGQASAWGRALDPTVTVRNARTNAGWYELLSVLHSAEIVDDRERFFCPQCGIRYAGNARGESRCQFDGFQPSR